MQLYGNTGEKIAETTPPDVVNKKSHAPWITLPSRATQRDVARSLLQNGALHRIKDPNH
jgi:hypothetical protein